MIIAKLQIFLLLFTAEINGQLDAVQPARWEPINSDHEYFATKSILTPMEHTEGQETEFLQFYSRKSTTGSATPDQVMSIRKHGIYTTARWDYENMKAHFLYDKYTCDTHPLTSYEGAPIFFIKYLNPNTGINYFFVPIIRLLENALYTTDVKTVQHDPPINIRGRDAWHWTARIKMHGHSAAADIYYSVEHGQVQSVPLRIVMYTDESDSDVFMIYEIFKFRLATPDAEVFAYPEFAACETTHTPQIPQMVTSFHAKLEVKDHTTGVYESPVYDMNIHYDYNEKLSFYSMPTKGQIL